MREIFSWAVVIPSVITLALGGFGVLTLPERPEYRIAQGMLAVAAVYFSVAMFLWAITTSHGPLVRLAVIVLTVGISAWLLVEGVRMVESRKAEDTLSTAAPSPIPSPSITPSPDEASKVQRQREKAYRDLDLKDQPR